jgi:hypothetical protein
MSSIWMNWKSFCPTLDFVVLQSLTSLPLISLLGMLQGRSISKCLQEPIAQANQCKLCVHCLVVDRHTLLLFQGLNIYKSMRNEEKNVHGHVFMGSSKCTRAFIIPTSRMQRCCAKTPVVLPFRLNFMPLMTECRNAGVSCGTSWCSK